MDHIITFAAFVVSKCVFVNVCIYILTGDRGNIGAHAAIPWGQLEGQTYALREVPILRVFWEQLASHTGVVVETLI